MKPAHGTTARYRGSKSWEPCRCKKCKAWNTARNRALRDKRFARTAANGGVAPIMPMSRHGVALYRNWGCRCRVCNDANTEQSRKWMEDHPGYVPPCKRKVNA